MDEEVDIDNLTTDEQIGILLQDLPAPVQRFLTSPERNAVSLSLSQKYQLHSDMAGVFDRAYVFMLLGVYTPDEFISELRKGGLPEATVRGLSTDVNEMVFKKLREEERTGVPAARVTPPPQVPVMAIEEKREVPPNLPGQDIRPPQPVQPAPAPTYQAPPSAATPPAPVPHIAARTMASDVESLTQGYQAFAAGQSLQNPPPQPAYVPAPPPPVPAPMVVAPAPQPTPEPPNYPPPAMASVRLTPVDRTHMNAPITKEYGSDPYREPIE